MSLVATRHINTYSRTSRRIIAFTAVHQRYGREKKETRTRHIHGKMPGQPYVSHNTINYLHIFAFGIKTSSRIRSCARATSERNFDALARKSEKWEAHTYSFFFSSFAISLARLLIGDFSSASPLLFLRSRICSFRLVRRDLALLNLAHAHASFDEGMKGRKAFEVYEKMQVFYVLDRESD